MATPSGLADALFTPVQQRVLGLLFGQPERRFQSAELIRLAASGTGATHRVLQRLAEAGLVSVTVDGNQKYYQANKQSPVHEELVGLVTKTCGLAEPLHAALARYRDRIDLAFLYGSIARGQDNAASDIDLMVVSDALDYPTLMEALQPAEARLGRAVNPHLVNRNRWHAGGGVSGFQERVAEQPKVYLIGQVDEPDTT